MAVDPHAPLSYVTLLAHAAPHHTVAATQPGYEIENDAHSEAGVAGSNPVGGTSRMAPDRTRSGVFDILVTAARCVVVRT